MGPEIVISAVVAATVGAAVAAIVSLSIARRSRIHEYLNAKRLQIWGDNGTVAAYLFGGRDGAELWFGAANNPAQVILSAGGLCVRNPNPREGSRELVDRIRLGVDDHGVAALELFDDNPGDGSYIPEARIAVTVSRDGAPTVRLRAGLTTLEVVPKERDRVVLTCQTLSMHTETGSWEWPNSSKTGS